MSNWTGLLFQSYVVPSPFYPRTDGDRPDTRGSVVVRSVEATLRNTSGVVYHLNFDPDLGWGSHTVALAGAGPAAPYGLQPSLLTAPFTGVGYLGAPGVPATPTGPTFGEPLDPTPPSSSAVTGVVPSFGGVSVVSSPPIDGLGERELPLSQVATENPLTQLVTRTRVRPLASVEVSIAAPNTAYTLVLGAYLWTPFTITSVKFRGRRM